MKEVDISVLGKEDPFKIIGHDWMLITAGDASSFNTMTASWGGFGHLWEMNVATIYVRPERYTHDFIEANEKLTLSFYDEKYRRALQICGTKSGRDCRKHEEAGLTPLEIETGAVTFEQARLTVICRKVYQTEMKAEDIAHKGALRFYGPDPAQGGLHTMYILEVERVFVND